MALAKNKREEKQVFSSYLTDNISPNLNDDVWIISKMVDWVFFNIVCKMLRLFSWKLDS